MAAFPKKLRDRLESRRQDGSVRSLDLQKGLIDFASNDYLGFARMLQEYGTNLSPGSTGSRLISGNHPLYETAEQVIREYHQAEAALVFNSGYDANLGLFSSILQRGDYVFYDQHVHASIRDGIRLGQAKAYKFRHNDLEALRSAVDRAIRPEEQNRGTVYVVTESVFSMDGDGPDLSAFARYCRDHSFHLIVDEAHAAGILGPGGAGGVVDAGCGDNTFARIITFGKALGSHGAAVLGSTLLREYLVNFGRSLIYTTALPPASLHAILKGYELLKGGPGVSARAALLENTQHFRTCVEEKRLGKYFRPALAAVHCCMIGGNARVKALADQLKCKGFNVKAIMAPTVPTGQECLRFSLHAFNTTAQINEVLTILAQALREDTDE